MALILISKFSGSTAGLAVPDALGLCRALALTQAQVAERLSLDTETVSRFERGKHLPSLVTLERLAGVLATTVGELLAEEPIQADDQSLIIASWISALRPEDQAFACSLLKQCCDYLASRPGSGV